MDEQTHSTIISLHEDAAKVMDMCFAAIRNINGEVARLTRDPQAMKTVNIPLVAALAQATYNATVAAPPPPPTPITNESLARMASPQRAFPQEYGATPEEASPVAPQDNG
jgi:hypothetical protein